MTSLRGFLGALILYGGSVQDCTTPNSISKILDTGIYPQNPVAGDTSFLWVNFDLSKDVTGGTVTYSYIYNYIPFTPSVVNLCDQTECPIYAGVQNVTGNTTFPNVSGHLEVQVDWMSDNNEPIWCVKTTYDL